MTEKEIFDLKKELADQKLLVSRLTDMNEGLIRKNGWEIVHGNTLANRNRELAKQNMAMKSTLRKIQEWDCLNPPQKDLCHDLPWLKGLVDQTLNYVVDDPSL